MDKEKSNGLDTRHLLKAVQPDSHQTPVTKLDRGEQRDGAPTATTIIFNHLQGEKGATTILLGYVRFIRTRIAFEAQSSRSDG